MRLWFLLVIVAILNAQQQAPPPITSPEVLPGGQVKFRLWAPKASEVLLTGDWMPPHPPVVMEKDSQGIWAAAAGPLEPNPYTYGFVVDGVRAADPSCRCTGAAAGRFSFSRFAIKGSTPNVWDAGSAPAGTLHHETFSSRELNRTTRFLVYTPPGYSVSGSKRFPVLLLFPGTPGDEFDWTSGGGSAEIMFDNLIAARSMPPAIVVTHASDVLPSGRRVEHLKAFQPFVVGELIPAIKARYRTVTRPDQWAIAGLSLGGEFAMTVGLRHPALFGVVASISGSHFAAAFEDRFGSVFAKQDEVRRKLRLIWIGSGTEDGFHRGANELDAKLTATGIPHTFYTLPGAHTMPVFRRELAELLPKLFR